MKLVISNPKTGKSFQTEIGATQEKTLYGLKVKEKVKGDSIGMAGYEFQITGGSDKQGFPMRPEFHGTARKSLLLLGGPGYRTKKRGEKKRKSVRGNTIAADIAQLNVKVLKEGDKKLEDLVGKKEGKTEGKKPEEKKEVKAPEKKEEAKPEVKKEEAKPKVEEAPKEEKAPEKKEEAKTEDKKEETKPEVKEEAPKEGEKT